MIVNITGDEQGSILIFTVLGFWPFLAIFGRFWHFWGFGGDLGDLGVLVSFKITQGIKLVVGRVTEGVKGSLKAFWGCLRRSGGSKGVCLTPVGHVLPLEVF